MAKLTKDTLFKAQPPRAETAMEKTTRIVRGMLDEESEKRQVKMQRLRAARLQREAHTPAEPAKPAPKTRRKAPAKAISKV
jgi:hypothetical protein